MARAFWRLFRAINAHGCQIETARRALRRLLESMVHNIFAQAFSEKLALLHGYSPVLDAGSALTA